MKKLLVFAAFVLSLAGCSTITVPPESVALGERLVDFKSDRDVISIGDKEGLFRSLYFVVKDNSLEVFNLVIVYGNDVREKLDVRLTFAEGSRSRLVDLSGNQRKIQSIEFTYKTIGSWRGGKARMIVYGVR